MLLSHNGMDVDLKLAEPRARHRHHPRRPHARCRAAAYAGEQPGRQDAGHQWRVERQVRRRGRPRCRAGPRGGRDATRCCRCSPICCRPIRRWPRASTSCARRTPRNWTRRSRTAGELLYRRGNFTGTMDHVICDGVAARTRHADRALAGVPLGTERCCPGRRSRWIIVYAHTAITYPAVYVQEMTGRGDQGRDGRRLR